MKTLEMNLTHEGERKKFHLRLNAGGQKRLKEKFGEDTLSILLGSVSDIDYMTAVFDEALNYDGNDNAVTDGNEFYDLLVDNDKVGNEQFADVVLDIAVNSGIIKKDQKNALMKSVKRTYDGVFEGLDEAVDKITGENQAE